MEVEVEDRRRYSVGDNSHNNKPEEEVLDSSVEQVQLVRPALGYLAVDNNSSHSNSNNNYLSKHPGQDYSEGRTQPHLYLGKHSLSSSKQEGVGVYLVVELAQLLEEEEREDSSGPSSHNNSSKLGQGYSISVALPHRPSRSSSSKV